MPYREESAWTIRKTMEKQRVQSVGIGNVGLGTMVRTNDGGLQTCKYWNVDLRPCMAVDGTSSNSNCHMHLTCITASLDQIRQPHPLPTSLHLDNRLHRVAAT
jgi:hypothetical protein